MGVDAELPTGRPTDPTKERVLTTMVAGRLGTWTDRHPLIFYFALTYAISWPLWLLSRLAGGTLVRVCR